MREIKDLFDFGLGAIVLTQEKLEKSIDAFIKKGRLEERAGKSLLLTLVRKGEQERRRFTGKITRTVRRAVSELDLATRDELDRLKKEIAELKRTR